MQKRIFSELKGLKDAQKKTVLRSMEAKIKECDEKKFVIPRIGLRHQAQVDKGLGNLFREFEEQVFSRIPYVLIVNMMSYLWRFLLNI